MKMGDLVGGTPMVELERGGARPGNRYVSSPLFRDPKAVTS